jgi:hypothetical protein
MKDISGELAYERYFSSEPVKKPDFEEKHLYEEPKPTIHYKEIIDETKKAIPDYADGNISSIEELADIIKKLCNAAWGTDWGEFSPDIKYGENSDDIILPQITIEINTREVTEDTPIKPVLMNVIKEQDAQGNETGDAILVYRQLFDCNVEFNIYGRNAKEARDYMDKLESLLIVYAGYLKRKGLSEILFLKETSPKCSLNYAENKNMRSIYYYIRLEKITTVRQSRINAINTILGLKPLQTDKVTSLLQRNKREDIELDFFDGDNGITYNN